MQRKVQADTGRHVVALAAILVLAAGLRLGFLTSRGWWFDEAATVVCARRDLVEVPAHVRAHENSPPLYFVLVAAWARVTGTSEAGLRSFSALLGVGTVWVAYVAAARLVSVRAGLVAAALASVNPMLVWFSLEARMYALQILLGGFSFVFFLHVLEEPRRRTCAAWAAASVLVLWTHYFAVFLVAPEAAWLLLRHPRSRGVRASLAALVIAEVVMLPFTVPAVRGQTLWMEQSSWLMRVASVAPEFLLGFQPPAPIVLAPIALLAPAIALWLLVSRAETGERRGALTAALVAGPALIVPALVALVPHLDFLMTRYLSAATVPVLVVVAAGLGARRAGTLGVATVVLTCLLGIAIDLGTARTSKFEHEEWRGAAEAIGPSTGPRALVVTPARGTLPFGIYRPAARQLDASHALVSEIVVVALPPVFRALGQRSLPPRPPSPSRPPFELVERVDADAFTLARYRVTVPVDVDRERLVAMAFGSGKAAVLLEPGEP